MPSGTNEALPGSNPNKANFQTIVYQQIKYIFQNYD